MEKMKSLITLAALITLTALPALADDAKEKSMPCTMAISAQSGAYMTTFTVMPVHDGALYNWMTSAGTITAGQGTASVMINHPPQGGELAVTVDAMDRDACPADRNHASISVTVPPLPAEEQPQQAK